MLSGGTRADCLALFSCPQAQTQTTGWGIVRGTRCAPFSWHRHFNKTTSTLSGQRAHCSVVFRNAWATPTHRLLQVSGGRRWAQEFPSQARSRQACSRHAAGKAPDDAGEINLHMTQHSPAWMLHGCACCCEVGKEKKAKSIASYGRSMAVLFVARDWEKNMGSSRVVE
eukprot:jgi/Botrbrau1/22770/Bobra.0132s0100.1